MLPDLKCWLPKAKRNRSFISGIRRNLTNSWWIHMGRTVLIDFSPDGDVIRSLLPISWDWTPIEGRHRHNWSCRISVRGKIYRFTLRDILRKMWNVWRGLNSIYKLCARNEKLTKNKQFPKNSVNMHVSDTFLMIIIEMLSNSLIYF